MPTIKLKNKTTPGTTPTTGDLDPGELALNSADGKVFMLKDNGVDVPEVIDVIKHYLDNKPYWDYESPEQEFTAGGTITVPHNLGKIPSVFVAFLVCKTAQSHFNIGDVTPINNMIIYNSANNGTHADHFKADATNLTLKVSANGFVMQGPLVLTPANFRVVLCAKK